MKEDRFYIRHNFPFGGFDLFFRTKMDNSVAWAQPISILARTPEEQGVEVYPMMEISSEAAQSLLDELWKEGFRPKDIGTAGHLAATQVHLSDMKQLVAKAYKITFSK